METDSANNQKLPISGDETSKFSIYSSAVHKVVVMFLCLVLFYAVLRVREAIYVRLRPGLVPRLVGHASHLLGGLAALVLIYVVSAAFSMVLLVLWFLWLFTIVYKNFREVMIIYSEKYNSGTGLPQLPPV
ncbi:unnamed protein product [Arabidopsis thaliana]|uniref:(thale cress) hypothetical protein n=1 Tax=Arabidopsis thaliana TaxID=3702 RepID=A0A7G2DXY4_ARATH|nr:unnamed protein product [Arabidopsis thaliana]